MKLAGLALLALLSVSPVTIAALPAAAQTETECATQISALRTATAGVAISGKNAAKDLSGLLGKLDDASTELGKGKATDAAKKLTDFRVKVEQLLAANRISSDDASTLIEQTNSAIACINA